MTERIKTIITAKDVSGSSTFKKWGANIITVNQGLELMAKALRAIAAPMAAVIKEGREFGAQMSAVEAVTRATAEEMKILTDEARRLGETTVFTGTQASKAMEELGRAGQSTTQIIETTGAALDLAAANSIDLAVSAKLMAIQMNIFRKEGLKARRAADLINQTINASPQNFEEFSYALDFAAGTASAFNRSFAETTQIIGALAEQGVRGSRAGTALSMAFARLGKPTAAAQKVLNKYGITLDQINPATNKFADIIDVLNKNSLTQSELFTVLGVRTAPKFFKLIQAGGDTIRNFAAKQAKANTALEAAKVRLNNLDGDITLFNSAVSGLKLSVFDSLDSVLRSIVKGSTAMVSVFSTFVKDNQGSFTAVFEGMATAMGYVKQGIVLVINALGFLLEGVARVMMLDDFQLMLSNWVTILQELKVIFDLLWPVFKKIGKYLISEYFEAFLKMYGIMLKVTVFIQKELIIFLRALANDIREFPANVDKLKTSFDNFLKSITNIYNKVVDLIKAFTTLGKTSVMSVVNGYKKFITQSDKAVISMFKMDDVLVGNTLVPGFKQFAVNLLTTAKKMQTFTLETKKANKQAGELDEGVKSINEGLSDFGKQGTDINIGLTSSIKSGFAEGTSIVENGIKEAFEHPIRTFRKLGNFAMGAINSFVNAMWSLFTSNKKFSEALSKIFETIGKVLAPIIEAFIPILTTIGEGIEKLGPSMQRIASKLAPLIQDIVTIVTDLMDELAPIMEEFADVLFNAIGQIVKAIAPIIGMVLKKVVPMFTKLINDLLPSILMVIEQVGPLLSALLDIIGVLMDELTPLLIELNILISEILPVITEILELVKILLPILQFIIQFLVNYTRFMMVQFIFVLRFIAGVLKLIGELLQNLISFIGDLLGAIVAVLSDLWSLIEGVFGDLVKAIESLFGGIGGGGDNGPDILDPRTWGFAQGTNALTKDQLLHLPGMESNAGLIKAHVGESVGQNNNAQPTQFIFNIKAIDPRATSDELRRLLEELKAAGKI